MMATVDLHLFVISKSSEFLMILSVNVNKNWKHRNPREIESPLKNYLNRDRKTYQVPGEALLRLIHTLHLIRHPFVLFIRNQVTVLEAEKGCQTRNGFSINWYLNPLESSNTNDLGKRLCSTLEDVQYCGGCSVLWGYHQYCREMPSILRRDTFQY